MTKKQQDAQVSINVAQDALQRIVDGHSEAEDLGQRRDCADWELCWLIRALISVLPNDLRAGVQTCSDLREKVWSQDYQNQYYAQQKASPSCLPATDSL